MNDSDILVISESEIEEMYNAYAAQCDCDCPDGDCCTDY